MQRFAAPGGSVASVVNFTGEPPETGVLEYSQNVTQFSFTPVPEPGSWALLCFGGAAIAVTRLRRRP
ncbi:MAG: PEP-CTERM sorting domain-containing protein [Bryobacteraceae bacterium]|nr:PEP-CTERM sorting domain-containing protein [Bryobacteraceae bacterium]